MQRALQAFFFAQKGGFCHILVLQACLQYKKGFFNMATLQNQGTLRFTPEGGMQSTAVSNITSTVFDVSYGLRVTHGVAPSLFGNGETLRYVVVMENTGSGMLSAPEICVDLAGGVRAGDRDCYRCCKRLISMPKDPHISGDFAFLRRKSQKSEGFGAKI